MVKFSVSPKHETLLSLHGRKSQKESLDQDKIKLERTFENCATNLVKMNYRLASVFSYERFGNALICIISIGPSTRHDQVEADSQLSYFSQKRSFAGTFKYCF